MAIEVDIVANESSIESALRKISLRLRTLEGESKAVATNVSNIGVKSIDSKKVSQEIRSLKKELVSANKDISNSVNGLSAGFSNLAKNLTLVLTGGALGLGFTSVTSKFNDLQNRIALVTGRTDDLILTQEKLLNIANKTFNSIDGGVETFNRFGLALRNAGVNTSTLLEVTENVQKALAISGGSAESTSAAIFQLGQGLSAGALRGQELNSVLEQAPRIATAITDELGVSIGELRKIAEEGGLTTDVVLRSLLNQGKAISKEFENITPSISKASLVFGDALVNYIGQLDRGLGFSRGIATQVIALSSLINKASVDLDLRIADKVKNLNFTKTFKDVMLVGGGVLNVLGAIAGRIGDAMPKVIVPVLTLLDKLFLALIKIPTLQFFSDIGSFFLSIRGSFLDIISFSNTLAGAMNDVFNSASPEELRKNLDTLAVAIDTVGKKWFNVFNYAKTIIRQTNIALKETARFLGFMDQKLIEFRFDTFEDFNWLLKTANYLLKEFFKNLLVSPLVVELISAFFVLERYLKRVSQAAINTFKDIYFYANKFLTNSIKIISNFVKIVMKEFYDLYIYVVGNSVWPDMILGIIDWSKELSKKAFPIIKSFSETTKSSFSKLFVSLKKIIKDSGLEVDLSKGFNFDNINFKNIKEAISLIGLEISVFASKLKKDFFEKIQEFKTIDFSLKANFEFDLAKALESLVILSTQIERFIAGTLSKSILKLWSYLSTNAPELATIVGAGFVIGLAELFGVKLFAAVKTLALAGLLSEVLDEVSGSMGAMLVEQDFFGNLGNSFGSLLGSIVANFIKSLPLILDAILSLADGFTKGFLDNFGIIGKALGRLLDFTAVGSIVDLALFGTGVAVLLGKFKLIITVINSALTLLLNRNIGGVAKAGGLLNFLLLGKGRLLIAGLLSVVAILNLFPGIFNDIGNSVATFISLGGIVSLLLFGPSATGAAIISGLKSLFSSLIAMAGLASSGGASLPIVLWAKDAVAAMSIRIVAWWSWFSALAVTQAGRISLATTLLSGVSAAFTTLGSMYVGFMNYLRVKSLALGGPLGVMGMYLFGPKGRAALLIAAILAISTTAAMAAENSASSGFGLGLSWMEYGLMGAMFFGSTGFLGLKRRIVSLVSFVRGSFRALVESMGIKAAIASALGAGFKAGLLRIGIMLLKFVGGIAAFLFSKLALVVAGIGILGLIIFGEGNGISEKLKNLSEAVTNFFTETTAGGREARKSIEGILAPLKNADVGNIKTSSVFESLGKVDLSGLNESQIGDMRSGIKASVTRLEELQQIYQDEGKLTRGERREANELLRSINQTIKAAPEVGSKEASRLSTSALLSSIQQMGVAQFPEVKGKPSLDAAVTNVTEKGIPLAAYIDLELLSKKDPILTEMINTLSFAVSEGLDITPEIERDFREAFQDLMALSRIDVGGKYGAKAVMNQLSDASKGLFQNTTGTLSERMNSVRNQRLSEIDTMLSRYKQEVDYSSAKLANEEAISRILETQKNLGFESLSKEEQKLLTVKSALALQERLTELSNRTITTGGKTVPLFTEGLFATDTINAQRTQAKKEFELLKKVYLSESGELVSNVNSALSELGVDLSLTRFDTTRLPQFFENVKKVLEAEAANTASGGAAATAAALENARLAFKLELIEYKALLTELNGIVSTDLSLDQLFSAGPEIKQRIRELGLELLAIDDQMTSEDFANLPLAMKEAINAKRRAIIDTINNVFREAAIQTRNIDYFGEGKTLGSQLESAYSSFSGGITPSVPLTILGPSSSASAIAAVKDLDESLRTLQDNMSKGLSSNVESNVESLSKKLGAVQIQFSKFEDRLEFARSLADNAVDFNTLIQLPDDKLREIDLLAIRLMNLRNKMIAIKVVGAITGKDVTSGLREAAAEILEVEALLNEFIPDLPDSGGGSSGEAKTWWESFKEQASNLGVVMSDELLAGLSSKAINEIASAGERFKAAQDAINKSAKEEVGIRRQAVAAMEEARKIAFSALSDGTFGGAKSLLDSLGQSLDANVIGALNSAQISMSKAMALRLFELNKERDALAEGSPAQIASTLEILRLNDSLGRLAEYSNDAIEATNSIRESFQQGINSFLIGEKTLKGVFEGVLDTLTSTILNKFSQAFTDNLFKALNLDTFFDNLFSQIFSSMQTGIGGGGGGWFSNLFGLGGGAAAVPKAATGGRIVGPGTGTSDSIMAMLSNGEYVVNAATTKRWLPFLETLNSNNGKLPAFAKGGAVGPNNPAAFKTIKENNNKDKEQQVFNINVTGDVSIQTRKEIARMIPEITAGVNMTNRERGSR